MADREIGLFSSRGSLGWRDSRTDATGRFVIENVQQIPTCAPAQEPPRGLVIIREGALYTVPAGRRLVVTAIGSSNATVASVQLQIDGVAEVTTHTETPTTMREVPQWLVVNAGSSVTVLLGDGAPDDGRAWGYLADP